MPPPPPPLLHPPLLLFLFLAQLGPLEALAHCGEVLREIAVKCPGLEQMMVVFSLKFHCEQCL